jgi:integrase
MGIDWKDYGLVIANALGCPIHPDDADRDFDRLVQRAGVKPIRIHDLRHTFATLAIGAGIPIKVVSESLGHADIATTLRTYAHVLPVQRAELAEKIGALLFRGSSEAM